MSRIPCGTFGLDAVEQTIHSMAKRDERGRRRWASAMGLGLEHWESLGVHPEFSNTARSIAKAYGTLGCIPLWIGTPRVSLP